MRSLMLLSLLISGCYETHPIALEPAPMCEDDLVIERAVASADGPPLAWVADGSCIEVTYDPSLDAWRDDIEEAFRSWEAPCSPICFLRAQPAYLMPEALPRDGVIHVFPGERDGAFVDRAQDASTDVYYDRDSGEILSARLGVHESGAPDVALLSHQVGYVLGLGAALPDEDSIMARASRDRLAEIGGPTCADIRSLCLAYAD